MTCQWSRGSMPVRSCRQPWGMKSPKRMVGTLPARSGVRGRSNRCSDIAPAPGAALRRQDGDVLQSWTSSQVRAAEEPLLAAGVPLMERAAFALHVARRRGAARAARARRRCAGASSWRDPGNNGGDALYAGALLARRGVEVRAVADGASASTRAAWRRCCRPAAAGGSRCRRRRGRARGRRRPGARRAARHRRRTGRACAVAAAELVAGDSWTSAARSSSRSTCRRASGSTTARRPGPCSTPT